MNNGADRAESESSRKDREEAIFEGALALPPVNREAFVEKACGKDEKLFRRIHRLIEAHEKAGDFLENRVPVDVADRTLPLAVPQNEKTGSVIGRYKIRELLGEGGCGAVYVAEQLEPVRRRVALKVIKMGMDTKSVIARFEAERQALALMDHPNIAKVLDAGTTATGRPYFVMELVRGVKITDYCDQNHLGTGQRLELFTQVCHAVQHAHQKGIIHRDLKPSNILVRLHDGVPVPKIIDFGIAKATEGRLTDLTVYTELHQFIGTPAYMSPEQAEMSGLDVDTRSDIYSLGVLLYELLTGKTPFDAKELIGSGLDHMRRTIREQEPQRPSTRLSTMLDADLTDIARRRGAEPPRLIHLVRGDLDWIVMKALEKDRTRRYETADGLSMDVQRFMSDEPVIARPPSNLYRFRKLARRNRAAFAAVGAVAAALILGLGASIYLYVKENQAYQRAVAAEKKQAALYQQAEEGRLAEIRAREVVETVQAIGGQLNAVGELMSRDKFTEAEAALNKAAPVRERAILFNVIAMVHARRGELLAAVTNYVKSITADNTVSNHIAFHCLAPLLIHVGQIQEYRDHCGRMLRQFAGTTDPDIAARTAEDCLILAPTASELDAIGNLAETAASGPASNASWPFYAFVKALAEYRAGHFANAVEWLRRAEIRDDDSSLAVRAGMVLAMAQYRLNQVEDARATLAKGIELGNSKMLRLDFSTPDWNDRMTADLLTREAEAVIRGSSGGNG